MDRGLPPSSRKRAALQQAAHARCRGKRLTIPGQQEKKPPRRGPGRFVRSHRLLVAWEGGRGRNAIVDHDAHARPGVAVVNDARVAAGPTATDDHRHSTDTNPFVASDPGAVVASIAMACAGPDRV